MTGAAGRTCPATKGGAVAKGAGNGQVSGSAVAGPEGEAFCRIGMSGADIVAISHFAAGGERTDGDIETRIAPWPSGLSMAPLTEGEVGFCGWAVECWVGERHYVGRPYVAMAKAVVETAGRCSRWHGHWRDQARVVQMA